VDVIIVGRGGGSIEDLWAFNEEVVARAIAQAAVPVISAVGHETDTTIADFVADRRAPTPSAAAEIVVAAHDEFCGRVDRLRDRLTATARARVQGLSRRVHMLSARPSFAGFPARVALHARRTSELSSGLAQLVRQRTVTASRQAQQLRRRLDACDLGRRFAAIRARLVNADGRLELGAARRYGRADALLRDCASRLEALSPLAVLGRGYAVAWNDERTRVLRNAGDVSAGDRIRVTLANGELGCDVRSIRRDE
jgi:exodeoxyribonuclease VII large subunit